MLQQNILDQLKQFIETVSNGHSNPQLLTKPSLIKVALGFLDELPATRDIVFDYFGILAEIGVQLYVSPDMADQKTGMPVSQIKQGGNRQQQLRAEEYESFNMVKTSLQNLVWKGPPAWSPLIANWSLELVAKLSDKYTQRRMTISASCNYWLECSAMHGLLTLINSCFRKLSNTEAESCVETMLNAFHRYPMTFDWIVARLGGCFPHKIIMQILQCGIKRFVEDYRCHLDSEAGILDYMTSCHEQQLCAAFREMLKDGLAPKKPLDVAIVPFLLITTNYSDAILQSLVNVFIELFTDDMCDAIVQKAPLWLSNKMFADMQPSLNNAVLRLNQHGAKLLLLVSKLAEKYVWCQDFLDTSMQEIEQWVLNMRNFHLLADLAFEETKYMLWKSCLSTNLLEQQTAVRLLLVVSSQHPHIYYQTISQLLRKSYAQNPSTIGALMRLLGGQSGVLNFPSITKGFKMVLEDITLQEQVNNRLPVEPGTPTEAYNTFYNLNLLAKMQKKNHFPHVKPHLLNQSLNECLPKIVQILDCTIQKLVLKMDKDAAERSAEKFKQQQANNNNNHDMYNNDEPIKRLKLETTESSNLSDSKDAARMRLAHLIVDLLNNIEAGARANVLRTPLVLKLAVLSVKYFFVGLTEQTVIRRAAASHRAFSLLQRQCSARKIARTVCLRELVESALFYHGHLLGQLEEYELDELKIPEHELLILQNLHTSSGTNSNRSVLHSGIIGRGLRPVLPTNNRSCDAEKQTLYLKALNACCTDLDKPNNVEGYSLVSLTLVELVSTDVMYNGLPFPDEEFTRVTMERDMQIRRAFITSPVLWAVLGLIATHRPALCYSSVLLRALCATCLHHWRGKNVNKFQPTAANDELMLCTKKLLQLLAMSQLIPPPLANLHTIIEHFEAPEIAVLLRECIWNYLKDHVPSPALFHVDNNGLHWRNTSQAKVAPQYVDTLRQLMQKKLNKLAVIRRAAASHRAFSLLQRQCSARKIARTVCLRELVESALFYHGHLLGQLEEYELDELKIPEHELLILQNLHTSSGTNSNRSVLHSGIIGRGLRPVLPTNNRSCDAEKQTLYLKALNACCTDLDKPNNVEGYSLVSLTLVELVSTDVMYNGLPFPDEEFTRVTMERDMQIRRAFITSPVLWAVLGLIATHRPALCYSSVLLRALCATCLHHWRGKNVNKFQPTAANDELMLCTKKLLQLLAMSQLIPPPLANLHTIIEHFEAPEIAVLLRECIWNYLKDHVPSPALFHVDNNGLHWRNTSQAKVAPQYVDTLRQLMQKKLNKLGAHYHQMFIMSDLHVPNSITATATTTTTAAATPATIAEPATLTTIAKNSIEVVELE